MLGVPKSVDVYHVPDVRNSYVLRRRCDTVLAHSHSISGCHTMSAVCSVHRYERSTIMASGWELLLRMRPVAMQSRRQLAPGSIQRNGSQTLVKLRLSPRP